MHLRVPCLPPPALLPPTASPPAQVQVLLDLLAAVVDPPDLVQRSDGEPGSQPMPRRSPARKRRSQPRPPGPWQSHLAAGPARSLASAANRSATCPSGHTGHSADPHPSCVPAGAGAGGDEVVGVEVYSLALFLFVHFYLREAHKADSSDVWPSADPWYSQQAEPSSPMRMTAHSWGREQGERTRPSGAQAGAGVGAKAQCWLPSKDGRRWQLDCQLSSNSSA